MQQLSSSYTPEQNGIVERKHRHIITMTRALLHDASVPYTFWTDVAFTATHLINQLPSSILNMKSPYELIHNKAPTYDYLKIFGCLYFP